MAGEGNGINSKFAQELIEWSRTGKLPESGNQDVRYFLELQKARLDERNLQMECDLEPPKDKKDIPMGGMYGRASRTSKKYESYIDYRSCIRKLRFYRGGKRKFSKKKPEVLYMTTTWLKNEDINGEETYCCPSCGAVSTIKELQEGCSYCNAKFVMSDLFPKVTDFFYVRDYAEHGTLNQSIARFVGIGALIGAAIAVVTEFRAGIGVLIPRIIGCAVAGLLFGYVAWAMSKIGSLLKAAVGSVAPLVKQQEAKRKITALLAGFDPGFSWEYFTNQLVAAVKIILFAKDRRNLVVYQGNELHPEFDEIVEAEFQGKISLNYYQVRDGYCYMNLELHMLDVHDKGTRLRQREDVFRIGIVKNVTRMEDIGFSIRMVQCKGCGGSFDATRKLHCPYCGMQYDMKEDGWVVVEIQKIR